MSTRDLSVDFGSAQTGVAFKLFTSAGTLGVAVTAGIVNLASGMYFKPDVEIGANRGVYWYCDTAGVEAFEMFNASASGFTGDDSDNLAALAQMIGAGAITYSGPVSPNGATVTLVQGMDYQQADGRALTFTLTNGADLTDAAIEMRIGSALTVAGTVPSSTQARIELTAEDTAALSGSNIPFLVMATLDDGDKIEIQLGIVNILIPAAGAP